MICQLRGKIVETAIDKEVLRAVMDVNGVGYEVLMPISSEGRLPENQTVTLYVSESVTAFDGATTLYGFASREEKDFYTRIRENVDGMGPKKAIDCLDKISKSRPDFKRAIIDGDSRILVSVFGFTKKTAEKLIFALKGKMDSWTVSGAARWQEPLKTSEDSEALSGLVNLGYSEEEARDLLQKAKETLGAGATTQKLLQEALRLMSGKI